MFSFPNPKESTTFCGADELCELDIFGFKHKCAEHVLKCKRDVRCGDIDSANSNKDADDALMVLQLGKRVKSNDQRESTKAKVMEEILRNGYKCQLFATSCAQRIFASQG